jgi:hypothetical protein
MSLEKENPHIKLSEKEIAHALQLHLERLGYTVVRELVLNDLKFDIQLLVGKDIRKVRIDVAAYKDDEITFIEVENGLWLTHPIIYRELAHKLYIAYPAEFASPSDQEQIKLAKSKGIGILTVNTNGSLQIILQPQEYDLPKHLSNAIISLIKKRRKN